MRMTIHDGCSSNLIISRESADPAVVHAPVPSVCAVVCDTRRAAHGGGRLSGGPCRPRDRVQGRSLQRVQPHARLAQVSIPAWVQTWQDSILFCVGWFLCQYVQVQHLFGGGASVRRCLVALPWGYFLVSWHARKCIHTENFQANMFETCKYVGRIHVRLPSRHVAYICDKICDTTCEIWKNFSGCKSAPQSLFMPNHRDMRAKSKAVVDLRTHTQT
jgi:hypothetical protein